MAYNTIHRRREESDSDREVADNLDENPDPTTATQREEPVNLGYFEKLCGDKTQYTPNENFCVYCDVEITKNSKLASVTKEPGYNFEGCGHATCTNCIENIMWYYIAKVLATREDKGSLVYEVLNDPIPPPALNELMCKCRGIIGNDYEIVKYFYEALIDFDISVMYD